MLMEFWHNFTHNLFKPLLLFFYLGFLIPILRVPFEFPKVLYQGLTIYLLVAIGWHGGEKLATVEGTTFQQAAGFIAIGFTTNFLLGIAAYLLLRSCTRLRRIDAATVAGYYGSDSAGTFVTCVGVLATAHLLFAPYMPVMLAVMEIPGCLVALYLVSRLRRQGMDPHGNMPDEPGYNLVHPVREESAGYPTADHNGDYHPHETVEPRGGAAVVVHTAAAPVLDRTRGVAAQKLESGILNAKILHEVFLNPGLYLLFGGLVIGFIAGKQGPEVTKSDDPLFVSLFEGILCLFLLEMGMTACKRLRDLRSAGWRFIAFGLLAPNLFAASGIFIAHLYSLALGQAFELGTYVLFAVLCGAASYIAVPAVQRLAIPEASPTLPLAASLGLTFSYNVTIGIPVYIEIAKAVTHALPV
jgi:uncharacterized protein